MSDVARIYVSQKRSGGLRFRRFRRLNFRHRGGFWGSIIAGALAFLGLWFLWATRDNYSMQSLVPSDQKYHVFLSGLMAKREAIANSRAWSLAPADSGVARLPELLRTGFGLPDWVVNNVAYGDCHVSGKDIAALSDVLFVTRMSRLGCLAERFHGFVGVLDDFSGGLQLRRLPEANLYYAVRGRVLVASPLRDAVIRALTLREEDALTQEDLDRGLGEAGNADIYGRFSLDREDPLGEVFSQVRVQMHFEEAGVRASLRAVLGDVWRARLAGVLSHASPTVLTAAPAGVLEISANLGVPLGELLHGAARAADPSGRADELLTQYLMGGPDSPLPGAVVDSVLASLGPGWRICLRGIDIQEMVPAPQIAGIFDVAGLPVADLIALIPPPPEGAPVWASYPRRDEDKGLVYVPAIGGPSLTPAFAPYGNGLLLGNSRTLVEGLLADPAAQVEMGERGNLFIRLRPSPACKAIAEAGMVLARNGLLRGFTEESFREAAGYWQATSDRVSEVSLLGAHQDGEVSLYLRVAMTAPEAETPPA